MEPIAVVIGSLRQLTALLKQVVDSRDRMADHAEKTLVAVSEAVTETLKYETIRDTKNGKRDKQQEMTLAGLWKKVSILVLSHDAELARRLEQKGEYWMNPENWSDTEVQSARIELERVDNEASRMLKPKLRR